MRGITPRRVGRVVATLSGEVVSLIGSGKIKIRMIIGVLALQGDFDAHRRRLEELGAEIVLVKKPGQLDEIDGLSPTPSILRDRWSSICA